NLQPAAALLGTDVATVRKVLAAWGPGKFDAELFMDGKGFRPDGKSSAVLIPPAFGLAGGNPHNLNGLGSVTYWNAFVGKRAIYRAGLESAYARRDRSRRLPGQSCPRQALPYPSAERTVDAHQRWLLPRRTLLNAGRSGATLQRLLGSRPQ